MKSLLSARIAWRYLCAKKSHSAVGTITAVSVCGIAVATAAIICVLSVFNGFKSIIAGRIDTLTPDVMITPAKGKVFANGDSLASEISMLPEVKTAVPTILENALAISNGREMPISLKGVDMKLYRDVTSLDSLIIDRMEASPVAAKEEPLPDSASPMDKEDEDEAEDGSEITPEVTIAVGTASRLYARPGDTMLLFAPRREGRVNLANPLASFLRDSVLVKEVYRSNQTEFDENRVIVDIEVARDLFQYDMESSAIEVEAAPGISSDALARMIDTRLNHPEKRPGQQYYIVKDRLQQQEMNFRMISIEKWVTFLLLFFILIIASFNIISSLSMLVIEKEKSMSTLRALGMSRRRIGSVFCWESIFVTLVGGLSGIIIGLILCLLQEHFGFITLQGDPGSLIIRAYPVKVEGLDVLITAIPLLIIGMLSAAITASFARSRI